MTLNTVKRALLDKLRIIDQTDNDHWLSEPIHIALDSMSELEVYKRALEISCEWNELNLGYLNVDECLQKAREDND